MKTWIRIPAWVDDNEFDPYTKCILLRLFNKSFYNNGFYSSVECNITKLARELSMSRPTLIKHLADLESDGWIKREGSTIILVEYHKCKTDLHQAPEVLNELTVSVKQIDSDCKTDLHQVSNRLTPTPVYDRLEQGFPTLLVLLKYFYSKTTVVGVDDFIMILKNCHKMEVFIMARKENFTDPGDKMLGFKNNNKFQGCIKWILEAYEEDDNSGDDLPMDRYLLYLLLDCIRNGKKPEGRFISAITKLQNDGERFPIDLTEAKLIDEKDAAKVEMTRRVQSTLRMVDDLDKPIDATRVGDINLVEMFKNKQREVN